MGQLKQVSFSRRGTAKVCPAGASLPAKPQELAGPRGETLLQRLSCLDSELEMSRAHVGARGEPSLIELTGDRLSKPEPKTRILHYEEKVFVCEDCSADARRVYLWGRKWRCLPCFKLAARAAGAAPYVVSSYSVDPLFRAEEWRTSSGVRPVEERHLRPKLKGRAYTKGFPAHEADGRL